MIRDYFFGKKARKKNLGIHTNMHPEQTYWDVQPTKKKPVSFSYQDILSSLNLVVNEKGVLQYMTPTGATATTAFSSSASKDYSSQVSSPAPTAASSASAATRTKTIRSPYFSALPTKIKPVVEPEPLPVVQLSEEQIKQILLQERIRKMAERHRIHEIKSKKIHYVGNNTTNQSAGYVQQPQLHQRVSSMNHLFRLKN
jgi:hypothetical protein